MGTTERPMAEEPRIEIIHVRYEDTQTWDEEGEKVYQTIPCAFEIAEATAFIGTAYHPVGKNEFGMSVLVTPAEVELDEDRRKVIIADLLKYVADYPEGEPNDR